MNLLITREKRFFSVFVKKYFRYGRYLEVTRVALNEVRIVNAGFVEFDKERFRNQLHVKSSVVRRRGGGGH